MAEKNMEGFHRMENNKGLPEEVVCLQSERLPFAVWEVLKGEPKEEEIEAWRKKNPFFKFLLVHWSAFDEEQLIFYSSTKQVRALEFMDYLIPEYGLSKGNAQRAEARISVAMFDVSLTDSDIQDALQYYLQRTMSYFLDCEWINAAEYGSKHQEEILGWKQYQKKKIAWAVVHSLDVVEKGHIICVRSLENESGISIPADEEVYIMIGCRGEVYDIKKSRFEATYEETQESLDVFEKMMDYIPEIMTEPQGEYFSLDEFAHLCYPRPGAGIYARQLTKRTKVFPKDGGQEYYLGRAGDYLAARPDDLTDIYIVQQNVFERTYEEK